MARNTFPVKKMANSMYRNFNVVAGVVDPGPASPRPATEEIL